MNDIPYTFLINIHQMIFSLNPTHKYFHQAYKYEHVNQKIKQLLDA